MNRKVLRAERKEESRVARKRVSTKLSRNKMQNTFDSRNDVAN